MTNLSRRRRSGGHNLLEMLIATVIFATAMISFASVFQYISIATGRARTRIMGQYLAKGLMEECLAAKFYNVVNLASQSGNITLPTPVTTYPDITMIYRKDGTEISHIYQREVQVDNSGAITSSGNPVFASMRGRLVRVRVSWEEKNQRGPTGGKPYAEYRTYIGENS